MSINNKLKIIILISACAFITMLWKDNIIPDDLQSIAQINSEKILLSSEHEFPQALQLPVVISPLPSVNEATAPTVDSTVGFEDIHDEKIEKNLTADDLVGKAELLNRWLLSSSQISTDFNFSNEMRNRFEQENIDVYWAAEQEFFFQSLFIDSPELVGTALTGVKCRKAQCELTIAITGIDQANQLVGQVNTVLLQQGYEKLMVIAAPDERRSITRLYISSIE